MKHMADKELGPLKIRLAYSKNIWIPFMICSDICIPDCTFHRMTLEGLNRAGLGMFAAGSESAFCQGSQHEQTCSGSRRSCTLAVSTNASRRYPEPNPTVCGTESKVGGGEY